MNSPWNLSLIWAFSGLLNPQGIWFWGNMRPRVKPQSTQFGTQRGGVGICTSSWQGTVLLGTWFKLLKRKRMLYKGHSELRRTYTPILGPNVLLLDLYNKRRQNVPTWHQAMWLPKFPTSTRGVGYGIFPGSSSCISEPPNVFLGPEHQLCPLTLQPWGFETENENVS